jgi:hypothetical protein
MVKILHLALVLWMVIPFPYFMTAGANIFTVPLLLDSGAMLERRVPAQHWIICVYGD